MKMILLAAFVLAGTVVNAQSLKEALYGGKLRADTGAVIRKGDSSKIRENMAQKVTDDSLKVVQKAVTDSIKKETIAVEKEKAIAEGRDTLAVIAALDPEAAAAATAALPKDNNKIWKGFIDSLNTTVKSEVLPSNKIKNGAYSVLIEYEIRQDGQIGINNVASDPKNAFLEQQVRDRLTYNAPQMAPILGPNGKPRDVKRKQMLSFVKQ